MGEIGQSVGESGRNDPADVTIVQTMLNQIGDLLGSAPLPVNGNCTPSTIETIRNFQFRLVNLLKPDGKIDPGGRSWNKLVALTSSPRPSTRVTVPAASTADRLSGKAWWTSNQARYPNSANLIDLEPDFRARATAFVDALRAAGASVQVNATRRNRTRAWLMHFCCLIAKNAAAVKTVTKNDECDIIWDHGNDAATRQGAQEMMICFNIAFPAALKSRHIDGKAVDMTIAWRGTLAIRDARGRTVSIAAPRDGSNPALHAVGASYGVVKLLSDPPHWSSDGH
ncbi:hypothetical protein [Sphingomonas sp.]|uniref:hypothetical protein n=1 Tax=Sphingomonas sp. TaxID=28214 RepID=UPI0025D26F79|nr:hypothetical protein [Sphingomonas sp.]